MLSLKWCYRDDKMKIGIVGAGTMGRGIAELCLLKGHDVLLVNHKQENLDRAKRQIALSIGKLVKKGTIPESQKEVALKKIAISVNKKDLKDRELIIEAIVEDINIKKILFVELDKINPNAILASNTSTIPISKLQTSLNNPGRVIGMHFMNPPGIMKLVEVVKGQQTDQQTIEQSLDFLNKLDKIPVEVKDTPGFVINNILIPMINQAAWLAHNEVAKIDDIDTIMEIGANHTVGPFRLADLIGIDAVVHMLKLLEFQTQDPKFKPCPILVNKVNQNKLGRKTGEGFYKY